jgi:hypothetical protein
MPHAVERRAGIGAGSITHGGRSEEEIRRSIIVASDDFWKDSIVNCENGTPTSRS